MAAKLYEILRAERLVAVKFGKHLTLDEVEKYARDLCADPGFEPTFSEIVDLSEVENVEIDAKHALQLADRIDPFARSALRAFVAYSPAQIHTARMHQLLRGLEDNFGIFASMEEALAWVRKKREAETPDNAPPKSFSARSGI